MGAATAIASGALGAGQGIYQMIQSGKQKRRAQEAIDNFKAQTLTNSFRDVQVSTLGSDLIKEQAGATTASTIDALQKAGSRTLAAGAGAVVASNVAANQQAAADLDRQRQNIDMQAASEDQNIQRIQEERERAELAGLGNQLDVATQGVNEGMATLINSGMTMSQGMNTIRQEKAYDKMLEQQGYSGIFGNDKKDPSKKGLFNMVFGNIFGGKKQ